MSSRARRVLFALHEPGYFRLYGRTIVELANRGWDVALVFDKPDRRGPGVDVPVDAGAPVRSLGQLPGEPSSLAMNLRAFVDSLRYLEPAFAGATYLRRRAEKDLPPALHALTRVEGVPRWIVSAAIAATRLAERLMPINRQVLQFVRDVDPGLVVVSPLVVLGRRGAHETEVVKAARALGVPVVVAVASWDHLTSKGLIRVVPDAVTVWNDAQAEEAVRLHRIPKARVVVTGAQSLDRWFQRPREGSVDDFRRSLGIEPHRRVLLWVGSSPNMAPGDSEVRLVQKWLAAVRASDVTDLRDAFVIVRPHPANTDSWQDVDLDDAHTAIHPRSYESGILFKDADVETFWYSLLASDAVVGVNTTAMIEAAIVRRPVFSLRDAAFVHSQEQTLHFRYLSAAHGGCATVADTLPEHVAQLQRCLTAPGVDLRSADDFVSRFVRPLGMATSATAHLCDALERIAAARHAPASPVVDAMSTKTSGALPGGR